MAVASTGPAGHDDRANRIRSSPSMALLCCPSICIDREKFSALRASSPEESHTNLLCQIIRHFPPNLPARIFIEFPVLVQLGGEASSGHGPWTVGEIPGSAPCFCVSLPWPQGWRVVHFWEVILGDRMPSFGTNDVYKLTTKSHWTGPSGSWCNENVLLYPRVLPEPVRWPVELTIIHWSPMVHLGRLNVASSAFEIPVRDQSSCSAL